MQIFENASLTQGFAVTGGAAVADVGWVGGFCRVPAFVPVFELVDVEGALATEGSEATAEAPTDALGLALAEATASAVVTDGATIGPVGPSFAASDAVAWGARSPSR